MMINVLFDQRCAMGAKLKDRNLKYDTMQYVAMDGIHMKTQRQKMSN